MGLLNSCNYNENMIWFSYLVPRVSNSILVVGKTLERTNEVAYHTGPVGEIEEFNLADNVEARFVKLTVNGSDSLKICEVQVFGSIRKFMQILLEFRIFKLVR